MDDWEREAVVMAKESWEDEEVADSWDAEEEEEEVEEVKPVVVKATPSATKATTTATPSTAQKEETSQERKERLERAIKESDLENAMALFGISKDQVNVDEVLEIPKKVTVSTTSTTATIAPASPSTSAFDNANPQTWSDFESFSGIICKKLASFESSKHYPNFLEHLFRTLLTNRDVTEIRKLANMANEAAASKQRDKLNAKKKAAPSLAGVGKKTGGRADMMDFGEDDFGDEF